MLRMSLILIGMLTLSARAQTAEPVASPEAAAAQQTVNGAAAANSPEAIEKTVERQIEPRGEEERPQPPENPRETAAKSETDKASGDKARELMHEQLVKRSAEERGKTVHHKKIKVKKQTPPL